MLAKPDVEVIYDEAGVATGVKSEGQVAKASFVVGDPGYFPGKVRLAGKVVRAIAILVRGQTDAAWRCGGMGCHEDQTPLVIISHVSVPKVDVCTS